MATRCSWPPESSAGQRVPLVEKPDALEQAVGDARAQGCGGAEQAEPEPDELARVELRSERARVVLVGVAQRARAVLDERAPAQLAEVLAEDAHRPGGRPVEPGEDPQQRALPRAAGTEDDEQLALGDLEGQPLQRRRAPFRGRVDAEELVRLDRAHSSPSEKRQRPTRSYASRVATSAPATEHERDGGERDGDEPPAEDELERRQRHAGSRGDGDDGDDERAHDRAGDDAAREPERRDDRGPEKQVTAHVRGRRSLRLEVEELAALVAQVADHGQEQADGGEGQPDDGGGEREGRARRARADRRAGSPPSSAPTSRRGR